MNKIAIAFILILCILPPLIYNYQYPSCGDDSYFHMERIDQIEEQGIFIEGSRYIGQNFSYLILYPFGNTDYAFVWFNWIAFGLAMLCIYLFGSRLVSKSAGMAMMVCAVLVSPALLNLFHNGTIYNIINLYIFGLGALFFLLRWLDSSRPYHFIVSMLLLAIAGIYHSSSAMMLMTGIGLFIGSYLLLAIKRKDRRKMKMTALYLCGLLAGAVAAYCLNPELHRLANDVFAGNLTGQLMQNTPEGSPNDNLPVSYWLFKVWSPWLLILMVVSGLIIYKAKERLNLKLVGLMSCICLVMAFGAFTAFFYDTHRFGLDLAIMASILGGYLIWAGMQARKAWKYKAAVWGVLMLASLPAVIWLLSFHNAMTRADLEAVRWLNEHEGSYTTSSQVQPLIYSRFTGDTYSYPYGEYIVWRSEPQTIWCNPDMWWWRYNDHHPDESRLEDYTGLEELARWEHGKVEIIIYKGE